MRIKIIRFHKTL